MNDSIVPLLRVSGLTKEFPGVKALDAVDLTLQRHEIMALMGENGAGKSTLIKVLTGVYPKDAGTVELAGQRIDVRNPRTAQDLGLSTVYQEINLVPQLSVAENICLGQHPTRLGCVHWSETRRRAQQAVATLGLEIDVDVPLGSLSTALQQMVALARAVDTKCQVLILDEPTSSLDENEVETLFGVVRRLKNQGLGIIFVTHFLDQVYKLADRITVLRNGRLVGAYDAASLPRLKLISYMMGREISESDFARERTQTDAAGSESILELTSGTGTGLPHPVTLRLARGEILGLSGLLGSGRTETARLLFGLTALRSGALKFSGKPRRFRSCLDAIREKMGFCPEDRKTEGIIPRLSVRENIILALQASRGWLRRLTRAEEEGIADQYIRELRIVTPNREQRISLLSGGNQQKVILARWLASHPVLLILDEPTRGVDVGAKLEIERLMAKLAADGLAILFISSDLEETVRNCHRVVVLRDRRIVGELSGRDICEETIMRAIAAHQDDGVPKGTNPP